MNLPAVLEPLTPSDCDCRGLDYMPLEVARLGDSELVALSSGDEFKAAVLLWAKSWSQVPAASLPDDDRILARWAGVSLSEWRELRDMALRAWVKCADGRLYHPVIADLAIKAFGNRRGQAARANSRWAKAKAAKRGAADPAHSYGSAPASPDASHGNAAASPGDGEKPAAAMQVKVKGEVEDPPKAPQGGGEIDEVRDAFDAYNRMAGLCGLPQAEKLTDGRRKAIRARLKDGGAAGWQKALHAVAKSKHCRGLNDRKWKADLDFICRPSSFQRLVEGFYGTDAAIPRGAVGEAIQAPAQPRWSGPEEVSQLLADHIGAEAATARLARCRWRDLPTKAIVVSSRSLAESFWKAGTLMRFLEEIGVEVIHETAAAA